VEILITTIYNLIRFFSPCVLLGQWDLQVDYFEDDVLSGVIPVLFAEKSHGGRKGVAIRLCLSEEGFRH
jgi:hypothetical protein